MLRSIAARAARADPGDAVTFEVNMTTALKPGGGDCWPCRGCAWRDGASASPPCAYPCLMAERSTYRWLAGRELANQLHRLRMSSGLPVLPNSRHLAPCRVTVRLILRLRRNLWGGVCPALVGPRRSGGLSWPGCASSSPPASDASSFVVSAVAAALHVPTMVLPLLSPGLQERRIIDRWVRASGAQTSTQATQDLCAITRCVRQAVPTAHFQGPGS